MGLSENEAYPQELFQKVMHDENLYEATLFSGKAKWPQLGGIPFF